ncbi:MAG: ATP-binding protein [Clostridia bacterium]|nr:ATP-binding protein [Clostridia bacterium]
MQSRDVITRMVFSELEQQREEQYNEVRNREAQVRANNPVIDRLFNERAMTFSNGMADAFKNPKQAQEVSNRIQKEIDVINKTIRAELVKMGYPETYLQPTYQCSRCEDTGYVGELIHEICGCVRAKVTQRMLSLNGLQELTEQNFDHFDPALIPDTPVPGKKYTQRELTVRIKDHCETYANNFEANSGKGLLMIGGTGLGKTFLLNCVVERILSRGFSVVKVSAYRLAEVMRAYNFDRTDEELVYDYINADLLAIDDLGTEPNYKNGLQSGLYHILNERINSHRSIIVTTNMDTAGIRVMYGERIAARLFDPSRMTGLLFIGEDIRKYRKNGLFQ